MIRPMHRLKNKLPIAVIVALLLVFYWLAAFQRPASHHPYVIIHTPEDLEVTFLMNSHSRRADCAAAVINVAAALQVACAFCKIEEQRCLHALDPLQERYLSAEPLDAPSARTPTGVVVYSSPNTELALAACRESERQGKAATVTCYSPNTPRSLTAPARTFQPIEFAWALATALAAALVAWLTCLLIIRYEHFHAHFSHDHVDTGPQKFHSLPTPRIGGVGVVGGLLGASGALLVLEPNFNAVEFGALFLAGAPAFLGGIFEDVTKKGSVRARLLLTFLSGIIGAWLLGAVLTRLDVPGLDAALLWLPFAVAFTAFAVSGIANAINIIDGYNGISGGFAVIVLGAIAWVAAQVGDDFIVTSALGILGALLGFLSWNYPKGKVFLGDGGAYLVGFLLAELSVLLVTRNPAVSPWFPLLLMAYPVFETLFSVHRRKCLRGTTPGHPDALHLHQLIYRRVIPATAGRDHKGLTRRNNKVAPYTWAITAGCAAFALAFWGQTTWLMGGVLAFCALYVYLYRRIVTWRTPHWLRLT